MCKSLYLSVRDSCSVDLWHVHIEEMWCKETQGTNMPAPARRHPFLREWERKNNEENVMRGITDMSYESIALLLSIFNKWVCLFWSLGLTQLLLPSSLFIEITKRSHWFDWFYFICLSNRVCVEKCRMQQVSSTNLYNKYLILV